jgi:hypothetical protein
VNAVLFPFFASFGFQLTQAEGGQPVWLPLETLEEKLLSYLRRNTICSKKTEGEI